ncbi:MAG: hypothetical protein KBC69_02630 [Candidatus Magasanikbacteria bacterium]|nr:hypothetical protein [Candidatus Magasanikbacteria bacterium]
MSKQLFVFVLVQKRPDGTVCRYVKGPLATSERPRPHVRHDAGGSGTVCAFDKSELLTEPLWMRINKICKGEKPTGVIEIFKKIPMAAVVGPTRKKVRRSRDWIEPRSTGEAPQVRVMASALPFESFSWAN